MKNYTVPVNVTGKGMVPKNIVSYFMFLPDKSVGAKLTDSIYADMFEAIMGGLYMIGDSILDGLGDIYCRRWFNHIYVSRYPEFDASAFEGNAKSIVETLFSRFAFYIKGSKTQPAVSYESIDVDDKKKVGVRSVKGWYELGPNLITFLKNYARTSGEKKVANIAKYEAEITMNEGGQAPDVKLEASVRLLRWLKEECGIDVAWAERVKSELDAKELQKDPELSNMYEIIRNYLRKLGLSSNFYFKTLAKHSPAGKSVGIQIQTADKEGNDRVLFTRIYEVGLVYEARKLIVKDFAEEIESKR